MDWLALAQAGAGLVGGVASGIGAGKRDRKNRDFTAKQNALNKQWTEEMWNKENAYNDPSAQMARFKQAGLNPNLIYGQSNTTSAPSLPSQSTHQDEANPSQDVAGGLNNGFMSYVQSRVMNQQLQNDKKQGLILDAEKDKKEAETLSILANTSRTNQQVNHADFLINAQLDNLMLRNDLTALQTESQKATTQKIYAEIERIGKQNNLSDASIAQIAQSINESKQRIKLMKVQGSNYEVDNEIKQLERDLRRRGQNPNDPAWSRVLGRILEETGIIDAGINNLKDWGKFFSR